MAKNKEKFALDKFAGKVIVQPIKPFLFENYLPYATLCYPITCLSW